MLNFVNVKKITPNGDASTFVPRNFAGGFINSSSSIAFGPDTSATAVPEPFTIIGTLVGGTAALRMRQKLKSVAKG